MTLFGFGKEFDNLYETQDDQGNSIKQDKYLRNHIDF